MNPINSDRPLPTKPVPDDLTYDLTNEPFSNLTVIGYFGPSHGHWLGTRWVVQCVCGRYEVRRSKKLRQQRPDREYFCNVCEERIRKERQAA
jgi:hypothetical protein